LTFALPTRDDRPAVTPARESGPIRSCGVSISDLVTLCAILAGCIVFWAIVVVGIVSVT
jgi:hypothetical protein